MVKGWMSLPLRYNPLMDAHRHIPDQNRMSVLMAVILLAYALTRVINAPDSIFRFHLGDLPLAFSLNINMAFSVLAGGLAASGVDWLLRDHPAIQQGRTLEHWLLPTLTALIIGVALYAMPSGLNWWVGFVLGGVLLLVVFNSEYAAVDPQDRRYPLAMVTLTALSYALVLILAVAVRSSGIRLVLLAPALFITSGLCALRNLHLRLNERWEFGWAVGIALVATQLGTALHYWPITPVQYGLAVLGPVYALTSLAARLLEEDAPTRRAWLEPAVQLGLIWGLAILLPR